jgi:hypothetical protein
MGIPGETQYSTGSSPNVFTVFSTWWFSVPQRQKTVEIARDQSMTGNNILKERQK